MNIIKEKITTLFLDIGGVLLTNGWGHIYRQRAIEKFNLDGKEINARHLLLQDVYEQDKISHDEYLDIAIFYQKRTFSKKDFTDFMMAQSEPIAGAIEYFIALKKERGLKIVAFSNESRPLNDLRIKKFKLDELFDLYISSCYVHLRKPDPAIYRLALDTVQVKPEQCLYIDDQLIYIEMARKLGIPALHYLSLNSAKDHFSARGNE